MVSYLTFPNFYPYIRRSPGVSTLILFFITLAAVPAIFAEVVQGLKEYK